MNRKKHIFLALWAWLLIVRCPLPVMAQTVTPSPSAPPAHTLNIKESLEKSLAAEQERQGQLEHRLAQAQELKQDIDTELNAYNIQISAYNSLLLVRDIPIGELEKVHGNIRAALEQVAVRVKELQETYDPLEQAQAKIKEQYMIHQRQLQEMQPVDPTGKLSQETQEILQQLHNFTELLSQNEQLLEKVQTLYAELIRLVTEKQEHFTTLSQQVISQIETRKKQELFERKTGPLVSMTREQITQEFIQLTQYINTILSMAFWENTAHTLWNLQGMLLLRILLLFGLVLFLLNRLRRFLEQAQAKIECSEFPYRCLILQLLSRSLVLSGCTLFLYLHAQFYDTYSFAPIERTIVAMLQVWLFSQWLREYLSFWRHNQKAEALRPLLRQVCRVILVVRGVMLTYIVTESALGSSSTLLFLGRLLAELSLFLWMLIVLEKYPELPQHAFSAFFQRRSSLQSLLVGADYVIVSGGLVMELAGYGSLARYWYLSWARTSIVLLWGGLTFVVLRRWEKSIKTIILEEQGEDVKTAHQLRWLVVRLSWLALPCILLVGLLFAWGAKQFVIVSALSILTYPVSIGGLRLSILGGLYVCCILLLTHVAARAWRRLLRERILVNSGLEKGIQASITTLSVYVLWLFGILWALNAIGVGTTSLAVGFGALGIGLGFGLQSIFNNFMSGIILLFERPIEIGDVLEIAGKWGVVEKINVRSTVIRTYDNSALIIPNSDIISQQLTNWTFQDARMRRSIQVGVAYGSDVRLVEKTFYEIAAQHPRVLLDPAPEVLFSDFSGSALIFNLRIWTLLDYGLTTETDIRFEIERVFREKQLVIAFPQLDVHLHDSAPLRQESAAP